MPDLILCALVIDADDDSPGAMLSVRVLADEEAALDLSEAFDLNCDNGLVCLRSRALLIVEEDMN